MGAKAKGKRNNKVKQNGFFDPMAVTWAEKHHNSIDKVWGYIPEQIGRILATLAVFVLGISINGDWINILLHASRQFGFSSLSPETLNHSSTKLSWSLEDFRLQNLWSFWLSSCAVSFSLYFIIGGFLHWYFYVRQSDRPEEWKCQPKNFLTPELERHEIALGSLTLFCNASASALLACFIANGGYSTVYYSIADYGWFWFFLQWPVIFICQDYSTYWMHRIYHWPFLYKNFHKLHHKYKQPTAFSVTAIHPIESLHIQTVLAMPLFMFPVHWISFYAIAMYTYYHGIIDHSGVNFKAYWWQPWQPDAIFHDNHHQYFHVNFAFNIEYWDKLHGTYRQKNRVYREDIFYGKGKSINEVSVEELKADINERESENPLAYRENKMEYELTKSEINATTRRANKQAPKNSHT